LITNKPKVFSFLAYAIALCTPVFWGSNHFGLSALLLGWMGFVDPWSGLPWIANLLYFLNLFLKRKNVKVRIGLSVLTLICSSYIFGLSWVPTWDGMREPVTVGVGSMFWILSFLILFIGQLQEMNKRTKETKPINNNVLRAPKPIDNRILLIENEQELILIGRWHFLINCQEWPCSDK
jgi:hypothetical protein